MYSGIENTGWFAVLYFLSLIIIGNFVLFNLFLAILLQGFESTGEDDEEKAPR